MSQKPPLSPQHIKFTAWAQSRGVAINGVEPAITEGRGLGICAKRKIKAGEEVIKVPASALISIKSVPKSFREKHEGITVHGLLASFLAFGRDKGDKYRPWKASWPSMQDFESSMPLLWPQIVRDNLPPKKSAQESTCFPLPPAAGGRWAHPQMQDFWKARDVSHLLMQEKRLISDWEMVSKVFGEAKFEEYRYYWLVVNTRSFYWEFPSEELPKSHDDRMVLVPWMDYFNHSDHGCSVSFDQDGYTVTSDRDYDVGEELYTSYGNHSNDFLLVEYGFILNNNKWDSLPLDDFFESGTLHDNKKYQLKQANYWGNYTLSRDGVCHRTQVAVRASTTNLARFKQFVAGKEVNEDREESKADSFIAVQILQVYYEVAGSATKHLKEDGNAIPAGVRSTLISRWKQIQRLIQDAFRNGINEATQAQMHKSFDIDRPENMPD